ncbi:MAG: hypothetical protein JSS02_13495 [Planctomycetes bacterium]|nr:hypothetical protein [Planctomycetota bacterium]
MINNRLWKELDKVAARDRQFRFWNALAAAWLLAALVGVGLWAAGAATSSTARMTTGLLCGIGLVLAVVSLWVARRSAPSYVTLARRIEMAYPDLRSCLLAALEQQPSLQTGRFGFLQEGVITQALVHSERHAWRDVIPTRKMVAAMGVQCLTFMFYLGTLCAVAFWAHPAPSTASMVGKRPALPPGTAMTFVVEPGDTEIEKGSSLLVLARVAGPLPAEATLVFAATEESHRMPMSASLDDPVFGARIPEVNEPLEYHVQLDAASSPSYRVTVFEYPRLERLDARLVFPAYTGLEERLVQDIRTVTVVEGAEVTLICQLNKRVAQAAFTESDQEPVPLDPVNPDEAQYHSQPFRAVRSRRLKLELVDEAGRANPVKSEISIRVVPNQIPKIKPVFPARDAEVSALEELDLKATVWDDFGLPRYGVAYAMAGAEMVDVVLGENGAPRHNHELATRLDFEKLKAEPDQLLSYYFWAEDFDAEGNLRRTSGDMYFAEVRQFEEIFRQGQAQTREQQRQQQQQQQQQGGQNAQAAQQLAQLQKEIMNATWKLIRREIGAQPTTAFADDAKEVASSQSKACEQAEALAQNLGDSQSLEHLSAVLESMGRAAQQLESAGSEPSVKLLQPALSAEQTAYQGLLKLRAREHEIVRQQQQQQNANQAQQNSSARSQQQRQQLDQLELKQDENRYESQREARSQPEQQADREDRQVLNRLKELARRQHDLNERLKDLQSALQEAQTQEKKDEIRRQLKRLEEEQQQMLRDTDELASRMDSPENQERMSEERQQLEQTREQLRRTSESLEREQVTQAAASGTRAERELEDLRSEFRRRASGRFNEQVRDIRDAARDLERREQELGQKLQNPQQTAGDKPKSLADDTDRRTEIPRDIAEQRDRLKKLTEQMQETIQEAEQTEPLLSERLYEAARNLQDQNVDRALDAMNRAVRQGMPDDARQLEKIASRGIEKLREGVEKAAESVLGDETEALRRAREELQDLSRELNNEITRNAPDEPAPRNPRTRANARGDSRPAQDGDPQSEADGQRPEGDEPQAGAGNETGEEPAANESGDRPGGERPANQRAGQPQGRQNRPDQNAQRSRNQTGTGREPGDEQTDPEASPDSEAGEGRTPGEQQPGQNAAGQRPNGQPARNGQQPRNGQQSGRQSPSRNGQAGNQPPGDEQPGQTGQGERSSDEPNQDANRDGQQRGPRQPGNRTEQAGQPGNRQANERRNGENQNREGQRTGRVGASDVDRLTGPDNSAAGNNPEFSPITGNEFLNWSDRLRDVEEMIDDPELRAEAARIRDRARSVRAEVKRHSKAPNWDLVRMQVAEPLADLADRVAEEVMRRNSRQALVPLDRDPVPPRYSEKTRRYYEQLGLGK